MPTKCGEVRAIAFKKTAKPLVTYLEKSEMDALLAAPDRTTAQGRRDYSVILFLYNTGARADEATTTNKPAKRWREDPGLMAFLQTL